MELAAVICCATAGADQVVAPTSAEPLRQVPSDMGVLAVAFLVQIVGFVDPREPTGSAVSSFTDALLAEL